MSLTAAALYALVGVQGAGQSVRDLQSVSNQVNKTQGVMKGLSQGAGQMGRGFGQVGAGLLRVTETIALAAVGAGVASAKVGTSFEAMTELIHTQAGASQEEVDKMRIGIQKMVHEVGVGPGELAKALYHIESVGVRGGAALDILKASALGAKVGLADMESVTNALTAVWFSGIKGATSMTDAMAILDGIVGVGNMHLQDLTDSFKSGILGTSATYGVDIRSLGAAIATLTDAGVPADIAATRLNNTLTHLAAPTKQAIGVLKDLGLGQFSLAKDLHKPDGLFVALSHLHDKLVEQGKLKNGQLTPEGAADMSKLFGGSRFGATAMQLLTQMDRIEQKYVLITERSQTFGQNVAATMETAGFKWSQFKGDIEESALAFSQGFLPALARAGSKLDGFLVGHQADIRQLGVELGAWIDKIDWKQVEDGANSFLSVMKTVLEVVSKLPPQVDLAIIGFLGLNKVSGGLLGAGVGNIVGGLTGIVGSLAKAGARGLLSKVPVVGSALAQATSTPVFVTNWPLGGLGGGVGGAAAGVSKATKLGALVGNLSKIIGVGLIAELASQVAPEISGLGVDIRKAIVGEKFPTISASELGWPFGPKNTPAILPEIFGGNGILGGTDRRALGGEKVSRTFPRTGAAEVYGPPAPSHITMGGFDDRVKASGAALRGMSAAALAAKSGLGKMSGSFHTVLSGIEKRSIEKYGHAPSRGAVMGTFERSLLHSEKLILASHNTTNDKIKSLQHLQSLAVAGKDWGVAKKLKADITHLRSSLKTALDKNKSAIVTLAGDTRAEGIGIANAIKNKDLSVTVPITSTTIVSLRDVHLRQTTYARAGRTLS